MYIYGGLGYIYIYIYIYIYKGFIYIYIYIYIYILKSFLIYIYIYRRKTFKNYPYLLIIFISEDYIFSSVRSVSLDQEIMKNFSLLLCLKMEI